MSPPPTSKLPASKLPASKLPASKLNVESSDGILRSVLGTTLQGGAARAVILLGAFSALGALIAWLVR
jgi:hypothetical protein